MSVAWLECLSEKSSWIRNEQVCQGVKREALCAVQRPGYYSIYNIHYPLIIASFNEKHSAL